MTGPLCGWARQRGRCCFSAWSLVAYARFHRSEVLIGFHAGQSHLRGWVTSSSVNTCVSHRPTLSRGFLQRLQVQSSPFDVFMLNIKRSRGASYFYVFKSFLVDFCGSTRTQLANQVISMLPHNKNCCGKHIQQAQSKISISTWHIEVHSF